MNLVRYDMTCLKKIRSFLLNKVEYIYYNCDGYFFIINGKDLLASFKREKDSFYFVNF